MDLDEFQSLLDEQEVPVPAVVATIRERQGALIASAREQLRHQIEVQAPPVILDFIRGNLTRLLQSLPNALKAEEIAVQLETVAGNTRMCLRDLLAALDVSTPTNTLSGADTVLRAMCEAFDFTIDMLLLDILDVEDEEYWRLRMHAFRTYETRHPRLSAIAVDD